MIPGVFLRHRFLLTFLFFLFLLVSTAAQAREEILDFASRIQVLEDGSMKVQETIRVRAEGQNIKRGIYRDFPTRYRDRLGNQVRVDFEVLEVLRDGKAEPHHQKAQGNGQRVYFGQSDVYLDPGIYTYTLTYRTDRQLGFFPDHDELYWNVTGNEWEFPIQKASATVNLPQGIPRDQIHFEAYTGPKGAQYQDYRASIDASKSVHFQTTRPLPPQNGLTVVVTWPKGFVRAPSSLQKASYLFQDNFGLILAIVGLGVVFTYYFLIWLAVGKDPDPGTIIPRFEPPKGFSPASIRYLRRMGFDLKTFSTAIIDMAVKGFLTIEKEGKTYILHKVGEGKEPLSKEESKVRSHLSDGVELKQKNHREIRAAMQALKTSLALKCEKIYFLKNTLYMFLGVLISVVILLLAFLGQSSSSGSSSFFVGSGPPALFIVIWVSGWTVGAFSLFRKVVLLWSNVRHGVGNPFASVAGAVFGSLAFLPFLFGEIVGLVFLALATSIGMVIVLLLFALTNYLFYRWLKAPTHAGRKILDEIEGFRMFLKATEEERLNFLHPPDRTPELFEKYLPYALALDVEQVWAEQFSSILAKASEAGESYSPHWYSGSYAAGNFGGMASGMAAGFTSALAASSTAPGSSSGSGGGGSSGGGGGGGGGGGW